MERTYKKIEIVAPGKNVEIVNRQTDLSVEVFDAFAVPALRFTAIRLGLFRENRLCVVPRCGTTVAL
jgi:hypothetical protein